MIDPYEGAPQADIFYCYKQALRQETALDKAGRSQEERARREKRPTDPESLDAL